MISFEQEDGGFLPVYKLSIRDDGKEIGFYLLVPQAPDIYEVHTQFYPEAFGSAVEISKVALKEAFNIISEMNTLVTKVPVNNPLAKRLAKKAGMREYGVLPNSFKTDSWIDQELFYINREDV